MDVPAKTRVTSRRGTKQDKEAVPIIRVDEAVPAFEGRWVRVTYFLGGEKKLVTIWDAAAFIAAVEAADVTLGLADRLH